MDATDTTPALDAHAASETLHAGPYTGSREARDGSLHVWDDEEHLIALPHTFPVEFLPDVGRAIAAAYDRGRDDGRREKAGEIRRALDL